VSKLPTQLKWNLFVAALKTLGYEQLRSKGGSARHFQRGTEDPLTFHEPHGGDTLRQGTLTEYLRKLQIDREQFVSALEGGGLESSQAGDQEENFRRTTKPDGRIVSNCMQCFQVVADSSLEEEVEIAEGSHICTG